MAHRLTPRSRAACLAQVAVVVALGLASRRYASIFPVGLAKYPGDALYALMMFFLWGAMRPWASARQLAALAILTSFAIEFSQLYKAPWIEAIRRYPVGHLFLGSGFSARDLIAYAIGGAVGWGWERVWRSK